MQIRLLVFSFVVTVVIKLGIRKHKENIPQISYTNSRPPAGGAIRLHKYISLIYQFYF